MPRQHIVNSWVGAAEYPEGDQYSGEQVGCRPKPSIEVKIERSGDQWRTVDFNNRVRQAKQKSKQELAQDGVQALLYSLSPDEKKLDSLDEKEQALTAAYIDGLIEAEQYEKAIETILRKRYAIHKKMAKDSREDMQRWIEENGSYEDKKKLYNSKSYQLPLATQAMLLVSMKPRESTLSKFINWLKNN